MVEDAGDGEREWRFSVDEVGPDGVVENGDDGAADGDDPEAEHGAAGTLTGYGEVEPEQPTLENALFVAVGVYVGALAISALFVDLSGLALSTVAFVAAGALVGTLALFAFFGVVNPGT
ncbi:DUF7312 domain-containing protein [Halomicrobium urmianum]|uniref:DUF7312 domain-containing protein n=1 Tax=Halomicrobium urmianum TaxID=1586233 RepID=UPI001CD938F6|nr:hypothetical protein [Halomicrobium urmianum]